MFGYIRPVAEELMVKELSLYRAFGRGLRRAMRRETGLLSTLAFRDDFVFLALCRTVLEGRPVAVRYRRSLRHPFRRLMTVEENEALVYTAAASAVVNYLRKEDDICDRGGIRKLRALVTLLPAAYANRRAELRSLEAKLDECIYRLYDQELEEAPSVDLLAEVMGDMVGSVFSSAYEGEGSGTLYRIGYHLGRFLYLLDALRRFYEDRKRGNYNPFVLLYETELEALPEDAEVSLRLELSELASAVEALPFGKEEALEPIIKNILYLGLPARMKTVLAALRKGVAHDRPV